MCGHGEDRRVEVVEREKEIIGGKEEEIERKRTEQNKARRTCANNRSGRDSRSSREVMHDADNELESMVEMSPVVQTC
jgi:hypothetical protein